MIEGTREDRIRLTVAEARALGEAAMRGAGFDHDDARILTDHVLDAALCGYEYSGLPKLLNVVDYPACSPDSSTPNHTCNAKTMFR